MPSQHSCRREPKSVLDPGQPVEFFVVDWLATTDREIERMDFSDDEDEEFDLGSRSSRGSPAEAEAEAEADFGSYVVKIFGVLPCGDSISVNVRGFEPFFFVRMPEGQTVSHLVRRIKNKVYASLRETLLRAEVVKAKPFRYFTGDDLFDFVRLSFRNMEGFRAYDRAARQVLGLACVFESNVDPLLRFFHLRDIQCSGWLRLKSWKKNSDKTSTCCHDLAANYFDLVSVPERHELPPLEVAAFDIEADSSHGDFPLAKKDYQKLSREIITEYLIHAKSKDREARKNYLANVRDALRTYLELAFEEYFNNNQISRIRTSQPWKGNDGGALGQKVLAEIGNGVDADRLARLLATELPPPIEPPDYRRLSQQLLLEHQRARDQNNRAFFRDPAECVSYWVSLAFREHFDLANINRVYTKDNQKPAAKVLRQLVPEVLEACEFALQPQKSIAVSGKPVPGLPGNGKPVPGLPGNGKPVPGLPGNGKHVLGASEEPEASPQDIAVERLTKVFDSYLPPIEGDPVIQIGTTVQCLGHPDCHLKYLISLGNTEDIQNSKLIDDEHKDVVFPLEVLAKELVELDLAQAGNCPSATSVKVLERLIEEKLAAIRSFDQEALAAAGSLVSERRRDGQRATDRACVVVESVQTERELLLSWSRLIRNIDPDVVVGYNIFGFDLQFLFHRAEELDCVREFSVLGRLPRRPAQLAEQSLSSSALGENLLRYVPMPGRILVDLLKVIQREHRLDSYKLDEVSRVFLFKHKNDLPPQRIFVLQKGSAQDRRMIGEYCLIDCILCNRLLNKLEVLNNAIGMSNVSNVPLNYLFLRGQGIKILSVVSKPAMAAGFLLPVLPKFAPGSDEGYEGAIVLDPVCGVHYEPVGVGDFNSLYPSCMISENISHDSLVEIGGKYDGLPGVRYWDIEYDVHKFIRIPGRKKLQKVKCGTEVSRYAQFPYGRKALLPQVLRGLLDARADTREKQKSFPKGSFEWSVLEGLQLAYKITANSVYGQCGAPTSQLYLRQLAASVAATGRRMITFSSKYYEWRFPGAQAIYGDTDSVFTKFLFPQGEQVVDDQSRIDHCIRCCTAGAKEISGFLRRPHNLGFEKVIFPFVLVTKKRYTGDYYTKLGSNKSYRQSMGLVLKRRDNAPIVKYVFGGLIDRLMNQRDLSAAVDFVRRSIKSVLDGDFPLEQFVITKTLKSWYKKPQQIAHYVLAQRIAKRDPGNRPQTNERLAYAYVRVPQKSSVKLLQGDIIETPDYIRAHDMPLDYRYYIEHQIMNAVCKILELVMKNPEKIFAEAIRDYVYKLEGVRTIDSFFKVKKTGHPVPVLPG
ncbi:MAG: DNA polymerase domain-containing protein [Sulfobacillus sp.]